MSINEKRFACQEVYIGVIMQRQGTQKQLRNGNQKWLRNGHKHGHRLGHRPGHKLCHRLGHEVTILKQTKNGRFDQVRILDIVRSQFFRKSVEFSDFDRSGAHG